MSVTASLSSVTPLVFTHSFSVWQFGWRLELWIQTELSLFVRFHQVSPPISKSNPPLRVRCRVRLGLRLQLYVEAGPNEAEDLTFFYAHIARGRYAREGASTGSPPRRKQAYNAHNHTRSHGRGMREPPHLFATTEVSHTQRCQVPPSMRASITHTLAQESSWPKHLCLVLGMEGGTRRRRDSRGGVNCSSPRVAGPPTAMRNASKSPRASISREREYVRRTRGKVRMSTCAL